jgi:flavin reductase (DIM6/NTAB) family NADH-FMN oxidoreductase RutF
MQHPATRTAPGRPGLGDAISRLAGGVGVAACWAGEGPAGVLVSSIAPLSAEPARVLFCVAKTDPSHNALFRARECSLNILAEGDRAEAERFAPDAPVHGRFDPRGWSLDPGAPPRRSSALAVLAGSIGHRMDAGTHTAFVLNVRDAEVRVAGPLVCFDRGYAGLSPLGEA